MLNLKDMVGELHHFFILTIILGWLFAASLIPIVFYCWHNIFFCWCNMWRTFDHSESWITLRKHAFQRVATGHVLFQEVLPAVSNQGAELAPSQPQTSLGSMALLYLSHSQFGPRQLVSWISGIYPLVNQHGYGTWLVYSWFTYLLKDVILYSYVSFQEGTS